MSEVSTSRRDVMRSLVILPSIIATSATANAATDSSTSYYFSELDALDALTRKLGAGDYPQSDWDHWEAWANRIYDEIEALPPTKEYARLKARAVWSILGGRIEDLNGGQSSCARMVQHIVSGLCEIGGGI